MTRDEVVATMSGSRYTIYHSIEKLRELMVNELLPDIADIQTGILLAEDLEAGGMRGLNYSAPDHAMEYIARIEQKLNSVKKYCMNRSQP